MSYAIKEIYYTLQGEGFHTGRPAVFVRFAGCNLWSGFESHRATATCQFCDTDFVGTDGPGGGRHKDPEGVARAVESEWTANSTTPDRFVVLTGGEPMLQVDQRLTNALHDAGFEIAVETNGTIAITCGIDWICVSPKDGAPLAQRSGDELKLVFPQPGLVPDDLEDLPFSHFFLQPMDGPDIEHNTARVIDYCRRHPRWNVSIQSHKYLGIR